MKTVKRIACLFTFAALLGTTAFASDGVDQEALQKLRSQIIQLVEHPDFIEYNIEETSLKLRFMVNDKNEIVVLSTGTDNNKLDQYFRMASTIAAPLAPSLTLRNVPSAPIIARCPPRSTQAFCCLRASTPTA